MKLMVSVFGLVIALMMFSCDGTGTRNNENGTEDSVANNDLSNNNGWDQNETSEFVEKAALIGMKEVRAGEIAGQKAQDADVKEFGQMLVTDHRKGNQELKSIAQQLNATVPDSLDSDHKNDVQKLQEAKRENFRKEFLDMMEKDHEKAISEFEDASENVQDQQLKSWVDKQLPALKKHLDHVKRLKEQNKNQQNN